ncbi:MAG: TraB/GumN family protein [Gammaproteobacteria bacterium]|nr:TraB/GumN family protein [Gammaproteobacteria bacterium]
MRPSRLAQAVTAWLGLAGVALLAGAVARADDARHVFWEVKGAHNTLYLVGSVHLLKSGDSALPPEIQQAYRHSATLVMELNLNDESANALTGPAAQSTLLPEGQSLSQALGPELYASLLAHSRRLGLPAEAVEHFQPWFAAMVLEQLTLVQAGYESGAGVDMQLTRSAMADHKPIVALETMDEQIGFFSHLAPAEQRDFLRGTLKDLDTADSDTAAVVRAWQRGDVGELERLFREERADSPQLMRLLTTDRNRRWLPRIIALLDDEHDDMVVVGAMHLIGDDGLVALLKRRGYEPVQH